MLLKEQRANDAILVTKTARGLMPENPQYGDLLKQLEQFAARQK